MSKPYRPTPIRPELTAALASAIEPSLDDYTEAELVAGIEQVVRPVLMDVHEDHVFISGIEPIATLVGERWGHEYAVIVYRLDA